MRLVKNTNYGENSEVKEKIFQYENHEERQMKRRAGKPREITLVGNHRIRADVRERDAMKTRVDNAMHHNEVKRVQMANQYHLELQRLDAALHKLPPGIRRQAILMNRGALHRQYEHYRV